MAATSVVAVWCGRCGLPASDPQRSVDPRYPLVLCRREGPTGRVAGCGRVPGTVSREQGRAIQAGLHEERTTERHKQHVKAGRAHQACRACRIDPPRPRVKDHQLRPFDTRTAGFKHLEFVHHDRAMLSAMSTRTLAELDAHHRALHEDGR